MRMLSLIVAVAAGLSTPPPTSSHVTVANGWFRALPGNLPAGGYFELRNTGRWLVLLKGAGSPACGMLMLHKSESKNGVGSMEDVSSLEIPAGGTLKFAPGGYHLMCMDPTSAMTPGATVIVTLKFADGTKTSVSFAVKNAKGQ
ncbi:MAG TPA: copper chaperone PCu(A)C [Rhizomicrobium sp.]|jgi:copper(I)-binding protein